MFCFRHDAIVRADDYDLNSVRPILSHPLFRNNLGVSSGGIKLGHCNKYYHDLTECDQKGVFDTLVYLAVKVFNLSERKLQFAMGLRTLFRNTVDAIVDWAIADKLKEILSIKRVAFICNLLEGKSCTK